MPFIFIKKFNGQFSYAKHYLSPDLFLEKKLPNLHFEVGSKLISSGDRPLL
jgi:hypothetical protein